MQRRGFQVRKQGAQRTLADELILGRGRLGRRGDHVL